MPSTSTQCSLKGDEEAVLMATRKETEWLDHTTKHLEENKVTDYENVTTLQTKTAGNGKAASKKTETMVSWSAYHGERQQHVNTRCQSSLLPLFAECAHSLAMIKHAITVVMKAVEHLNPGQTAVIAFDQPLFALAKEIQWRHPDTMGEDKLVIMLGGLHIELAVLKAIGSWLSGSGWTEAVAKAGITSAGRAESLVTSAHITRTRYAHQVTASSLYILQQRAYKKHLESVEDAFSFPDWCKDQAKKIPQFQFWNMTLKFELLILILVRSFRQSDFTLYLSALMAITPWMFALDRTNYARWLPVHIRDMAELPNKHPHVYKEFTSGGKFTVQKTANAFSSIPLDQAHEQNNELIKGEGGVIGITENPNALLRWMVAGPELARMVAEFERVEEEHIPNQTRNPHHEQSRASQVRFTCHVQSLVSTIEELGNPFEEESMDLISLVSKDIADPAMKATLDKIESVGKDQYESFIKERITERSKPIDDSISRNKLPLWNPMSKSSTSKEKMKLQSVKTDCQLFSKLYIGYQSRDGDLDEFFLHENQGSPPSLSDCGRIRSGTKCDLIHCMDKLGCSVESPKPTVLILDGAVCVQMLKPQFCKTFQEYSEKVFLPYITKSLENVQRVDLVWDEYIPNSLKACTREKRGTGARRRVLPSVTVPRNWQDFLRSDDDKKELFTFLSEQAMTIVIEGKQIVATHGTKVLCSPPLMVGSTLSPCSHEEADTRMMVHVADAVGNGHKSIMIRTADTDVVVLAVAAVATLSLEELWVSYGTGKSHKVLPAHLFAKALGSSKSRCLPLFHALTGCDTTSFFAGHGKRTAWTTWENFPDVTCAFLELARAPSAISSESLSLIERYLILMYDKTSPFSKVRVDINEIVY